jgi:hypothetical protein
MRAAVLVCYTLTAWNVKAHDHGPPRYRSRSPRREKACRFQEVTAGWSQFADMLRSLLFRTAPPPYDGASWRVNRS